MQYKKSCCQMFTIYRNGGYIFVGLCKCKVYDRYFLPQCFYCSVFNHFFLNFPNKTNPAKFGKCAGQQKTDNCRYNFPEMRKLCEGQMNTSRADSANSRMWPILNREQNQIQRRTNYSHEKKIIKPCQSKNTLQVSLLNAFSIKKACHIHNLIVGSKCFIT